MILPYNKISINVELLSDFSPKKKSILFLHGFTGSANDWKETAEKIDPAFNKIAMDMIGHGKSSSPADIKLYRSGELVKQILFVLDYFSIEQSILCGYSMGGRAALNFAASYGAKISAMILESASAGIKNIDDRKTRYKNDKRLAEYIDSHSIEEFVNYWLETELFNSLRLLPDKKLRKLRDSKLENSKTGLANSLRGFGTGAMPYIGNKLSKMNFPVLLVTGELDTKFTRINSELVCKFPDAEHHTFKKTGHNVHLEKPLKFISVINRFLKIN
jgi:2-succinyl-6-hydroxy-2,4-cyclohexadiene-1-carboxylate synthase